MYVAYNGKWILFAAVVLFCAAPRLQGEHIYRIELEVKSNSTAQINLKLDFQPDKIEGHDLSKDLPESNPVVINVTVPTLPDTSDAQSDTSKNRNTFRARPESDPVVEVGVPATFKTHNVSHDEIEKTHSYEGFSKNISLAKAAKRLLNELLPFVKMLLDVIRTDEEHKDPPEDKRLTKSSAQPDEIEGYDSNESETTELPDIIGKDEERRVFPKENKLAKLPDTIGKDEERRVFPKENKLAKSNSQSDKIEDPNKLEPTKSTQSVESLSAEMAENLKVFCRLPTHLPNGNFSLSNGRKYNAQTKVQNSTVISLRYYSTAGRQEIQNFICKNFQWIPIFEEGISRCPSLYMTKTYFTTCYFKGLEVGCETPPEGTLARIKCKSLYDDQDSTNVTCKAGGSWSSKPVACRIECGVECALCKFTYVSGGRSAFYGEYPWIVGIYMNTSDGQLRHICGGSLISTSHILSAAHCFTDSMGRVQPKENYTVAVGKHFRDININELHQVGKVKRLSIHEDFRGSLHKYRDDIALIEIEKEFSPTTTVKPICIDWDNKYEDADFVENVTAKVAGWGFTQVNSNPADVLQELVVPYRTSDDCRKNMDPEFYLLHYTSDKICAGFKNESKGICNGDSGGGLYFASLPNKYYVRGITSLTRRSEDTGACDTNHYALYTRVSKYLPWIRGIISKSV